MWHRDRDVGGQFPQLLRNYAFQNESQRLDKTEVATCRFVELFNVTLYTRYSGCGRGVSATNGRLSKHSHSFVS
jgi:hypothetical protein